MLCRNKSFDSLYFCISKCSREVTWYDQRNIGALPSFLITQGDFDKVLLFTEYGSKKKYRVSWLWSAKWTGPSIFQSLNPFPGPLPCLPPRKVMKINRAHMIGKPVKSHVSLKCSYDYVGEGIAPNPGWCTCLSRTSHLLPPCFLFTQLSPFPSFTFLLHFLFSLLLEFMT